MASNFLAARKTGQAFFEVCQEYQCVAEGAHFLQELVALQEELPQAAKLAEDPSLTSSEKEAVFEPLFRSYPIFRGLLQLLIARKLFSQVFIVKESFQKLWDSERRLFSLEVRTPYPLPREAREKVKQLAEQKMGGSCTLEEVVDPELLGGVVLKKGSWVFDGSLRAMLSELSVQLKEIRYGRRL